MRSTITVYCSGGYKKEVTDVTRLSWDVSAFAAIRMAVSPINVIFLSPEDRADDLTNSFTVFGRDHFQISIADFVVVDARQRRGLGVGIEILSAKWFAKPVISVVPSNSHYRKSQSNASQDLAKDYVHVHLLSASDAIVEDFSEAGSWISDYICSPIPTKDISVLTEAISAYKKDQMWNDKPMLRILELIEKGDDHE